MAASVATLRYGSYDFGAVGVPIPQVGERTQIARTGDGATIPAPREVAVTLVIRVPGTSLHNVQDKVREIERAFSTSNQNLYFHDGVQVRINQVAHVDDIERPVEWGQYEANMTVSLHYTPLDDVFNPPNTCSFGGFTICGPSVNAPMPMISRKYTVERNDDGYRGANKVSLTLSGMFSGASQAVNIARWNTFESALGSDGTLVYGNISQSVKVESFNHAGGMLDRVVAWTVEFSYTSNLQGANNIEKMVSRRSVQCADRLAISYVPFQDGALTQNLGRTGQTIRASGSIKCDTIANARLAAYMEIESQFPANHDGETERNIDEDEDSATVEWSVTRFYADAVLTGGVYGG